MEEVMSLPIGTRVAVQMSDGSFADKIEDKRLHSKEIKLRGVWYPVAKIFKLEKH